MPTHLNPPRPGVATSFRSAPKDTLPPPTLDPTKSKSKTRLLLVDFRSGEAVGQHPDVLPLLQDGWRIRSAVPRIVESEGTKLLVVLAKAP